MFLPVFVLVGAIVEALQTPPKLPLVLAILIAAICAVVILVAGRAYETSLAEVKRINEGYADRYDQDLARWKGSYYCAKCDFVFRLPG